MKMEAAICAETNYHQHVAMPKKTVIFISKSTATANRIETYWLKIAFAVMNIFS
jgi:glucosamine 6-phosphate synthetase-like amidotransferase/phosphosugar isomerase protein